MLAQRPTAEGSELQLYRLFDTTCLSSIGVVCSDSRVFAKSASRLRSVGHLESESDATPVGVDRTKYDGTVTEAQDIFRKVGLVSHFWFLDYPE